MSPRTNELTWERHRGKDTEVVEWTNWFVFQVSRTEVGLYTLPPRRPTQCMVG